jgi:hypothetical protein
MPGLEPPYVVGLIELSEGVRFLSNVVDCATDAVGIDMPVRLTFRVVDDKLTLPVFEPTT